ncbi:MAG: hypothetical protein KDE45_24930, partial [Caldilineaceae bacterium]|nr:hypothetical protein [Caldilineaceae bacterium]
MFNPRAKKNEPPFPGECQDNASADLVGKVDHVRVVNTDDGWGFGKLYVRNRVVSFTGGVADLYEGCDARVQGTWQEHANYGWQVRARLVTLEVPDTAAGARAWLMHRFDDIGHVTATALVTTFPPPELWDVIENHPERLQEVHGIGEARATSIGHAYSVWKHEREQFEALADLGLKPGQIRK